jgi:carbohydrate-selective porin OprB
VFFEKKWFLTSQGNTLNYVTSVPFNGKIGLWGVQDKVLYHLYNDTSNSISTIVQTALLPLSDPIRTKQALKFGIEATLGQGGILNVTVDSENGSSPVYDLQNVITWYNTSNTTIPWQNVNNTVISWVGGTGYQLYKSDAMQWGKYLGLTQKSNSAGFVINTYEFEHELRVRF